MRGRPRGCAPVRERGRGAMGAKQEWPPLETQIMTALRQRGPLTLGELTAYHVSYQHMRASIVRAACQRLEASGAVRHWRCWLRGRESVYYGVVEG